MLVCRGHEPEWNLRIDGSAATLATLDARGLSQTGLLGRLSEIGWTAALLRVPRARGDVGSRPRGDDHARGLRRHDGGRGRGWRPYGLHRPGVAAGRSDAPGLLHDRACRRAAARRATARRRAVAPRPCRTTPVVTAVHRAQPRATARGPAVGGEITALTLPDGRECRSIGKGADHELPRSTRQLRLRSVGRRHGGARRPSRRRRRWPLRGAEGRDRVARERESPARGRGDVRAGVGDRAGGRPHLPLLRDGRHPRLRGPPRELHLRDEGRRHGPAPRGPRAGRGWLPHHPGAGGARRERLHPALDASRSSSPPPGDPPRGAGPPRAGPALPEARHPGLRGTRRPHRHDGGRGGAPPRLAEPGALPRPRRGHEPHPRPQLDGDGDPRRERAGRLAGADRGRRLLHRPGVPHRARVRLGLHAIRHAPGGRGPAPRRQAGHHRDRAAGALGPGADRHPHAAARGASACCPSPRRRPASTSSP